MINVLLLCGGGSDEHEISLLSAQYFLEKLRSLDSITPHYLCIEKDGRRTDEQGNLCELRKAGQLVKENQSDPIELHYAIPCLHGYPGETGDIQSLFEMMGLPYLGSGPEVSKICFNKVTTKLWFDALGLPHTPYLFLSDGADLEQAHGFFDQYGDVFVKASSQGSSIGCYHVTAKEQLDQAITEAFQYSPYVLIEQTIAARELEVAVFEYQDKIHTAGPGEIVSSQGFYSYDEKYDSTSQAQVHYQVDDLPPSTLDHIRQLARLAFTKLKLKDMARIDFFYSSAGDLLINEINTFPGHTSISLFPVLLEREGITYQQYLHDRIFTHSRSS